MKNINPAAQPFSTQNAILAYCLYMAGVPWADNENPIRVLYSAEILNNFRNGSGDPIYKGWELEDAVRDAHEKGRRGHVEYVFERTPRLQVLLNAFKQQCDVLEKSDGYAHELVAHVSQNLGSAGSDVTMVKLACIFLKMRVPFMEKWQDMIPNIVIRNEGRATQGKETISTKYGPREANVVAGPGFRIVSLNASKETREKLGL